MTENSSNSTTNIGQIYNQGMIITGGNINANINLPTSLNENQLNKMNASENGRKQVILEIDQGSFEEGFSVSCLMGPENNVEQTKYHGFLPPNPNLIQYYLEWQDSFQNLKFPSRVKKKEINKSIKKINFQESYDLISQAINDWLDSKEFGKIRDSLHQNNNPSDDIRFLIQTKNTQLRQLPWHLWKFFDKYRKAEVALSPLEYDKTNRVSLEIPRSKIRILAIFGNSHKLDLEEDKKALEILNNQAEIVFLAQKERSEIDRHLWDERGWDILFFAGHSESNSDRTQGILHINQTEFLNITELKYALSTAIERGLKLAIFNSCDGLGIANQLATLNIPQMIVMRQPIPDVVAQTFLKDFLLTFSQRKSFYLSVREAREKLQGLEGKYPCVTWLPIICQHPAELPMTWPAVTLKVVLPNVD